MEAVHKSAPVVLIASSGVSMKDCIVRDGAGAGLVVTEGANAVVEDCAFLNNAGNGIVHESETVGSRFLSNVSRENGASGIWICGNARGSVTGNSFLDNRKTGIVVADKTVDARVTRNTCTGNLYGLWYAYNAPAVVKENTFVDNALISDREIGMLWSQGDYASLEAIARRLRRDETRFKSGEWQLHCFYQYLDEGWGNVLRKDEEKYLSALAEWQRQFPDSVTPRVFLAQAHTDWAWDARGSGWASTVTDEGWRGFHDHLSQAWGILSDAEKLDEKDPELYAVWVTVAVGLGKDSTSIAQALLSALTRSNRPTSELGEISQRALGAYPLYYPIYSSIAMALLPRWGGSEREVVSFAEQAADATKEQEGDAMYARIAASVLWWERAAGYLEGYDFDWPRVKKGFEDILARYPDSGSRRNGFCLMACTYKDKETAAALFAQLTGDDGWDSDVWVNQHRFDCYREWAINDGPYPRSRVPLIEDVEEGDIERATRLVAQGEDVDGRNEYGSTALYTAIANENPELVSMLLDAGADANLPRGETGRPLDSAVKRKSGEIVRLLVEHGADVNKAGLSGLTPFLRAVRDGKEDMAAVMLEHGAELDSRTQKGWTPVALAAHGGHDGILEQLVERGADIHARTDSGWTVLMLAIDSGNEKAVKRLIELGADIHVRADDGRSALAVAVAKELAETVARLLENGADPNKGWNNGWSILLEAVDKENTAITRMLIERGADINYQESDGWSVLHMATFAQDPQCLRLLLETQGCDPNIVSDEEETPLHRAAKRGNDPAVELLLAHGADVNARDADGTTAVGHARRNGHESTCALLVKSGGQE